MLLKALIRYRCQFGEHDKEHEEEQREKFRLALGQLSWSTRSLWISSYQSWLWNSACCERLSSSHGPLPLPGDLALNSAAQSSEQGGGEEDEVAAAAAAESGVRVRVITSEELVRRSLEELQELAFDIVIPLFGTKITHATHEYGNAYRDVLEREGLSASISHAATHASSHALHTMPKGAYRRMLHRPQACSLRVDESLGEESSTTSIELRFQLASGCYATALLREVLRNETLI